MDRDQAERELVRIASGMAGMLDGLSMQKESPHAEQARRLFEEFMKARSDYYSAIYAECHPEERHG